MTFQLELLERFPLERVDSEEGRYYSYEGFAYPSVTSVLAEHYGSQWVEAWKKRVGCETARRISGSAKTRGTAIHTICENYLLNNPEYTKGVMPINLMDFRKIQPILDKNISKIYGLELPLFSKKYNTAGTTDAIVEWNGLPAIIDFKTSKKIKGIQDISSYLSQATIYAIMANEMYNLNIENFVILMIVDHEEPIVFHEKVSTYTEQVNRIFL